MSTFFYKNGLIPFDCVTFLSFSVVGSKAGAPKAREATLIPTGILRRPDSSGGRLQGLLPLCFPLLRERLHAQVAL